MMMISQTEWEPAVNKTTYLIVDQPPRCQSRNRYAELLERVVKLPPGKAIAFRKPDTNASGNLSVYYEYFHKANIKISAKYDKTTNLILIWRREV